MSFNHDFENVSDVLLNVLTFIEGRNWWFLFFLFSSKTKRKVLTFFRIFSSYSKPSNSIWYNIKLLENRNLTFQLSKIKIVIHHLKKKLITFK